MCPRFKGSLGRFRFVSTAKRLHEYLETVLVDFVIAARVRCGERM